MKTIIALIFSFSFSSNADAQSAERFTDFVKRFPVLVLPATIRYAGNEFITEYHTPDKTKKNKKPKAIPYVGGFKPKSASLLISNVSVRSFLFSDSTDGLVPGSQYDTADSTYAKYYINSQIVTGKQFIALIYEIQFDTNGHPGAEKILCTFSKKGKLTDRMLLASAVFSGTAALDEGFRIPFYPEVKSSVDNKMTIKFTGDETKVYTITPSGHIVQL